MLKTFRFLTIYILLISCGTSQQKQNNHDEILLSQKVSVSGVNFLIPDSWTFKSENQDDFLTQITCADTKKKNSIVFQFTEEPIDLEDFFFFMLENLKSSTTYKNAVFEPIKDTLFQDLVSKEVRFSGDFSGFNFVGKLLAFSTPLRTMLIMLIGEKETIIEVTTPIINTLSFEEHDSTESNISPSNEDWVSIEVDGLTSLKVPRVFSIEDNGSYKILSQNEDSFLKIRLTGSTVFFIADNEPKSIEDILNDIMYEKDRTSHPDAIIIHTTHGKPGDFLRKDEACRIPEHQLQLLDKMLRKQMEQRFAKKDKIIINWESPKIIKIGDLCVEQTSFHTLESEIFETAIWIYRVFDFDRIIEITYSCNKNAVDEWQAKFEESIFSLKLLKSS